MYGFRVQEWVFCRQSGEDDHYDDGYDDSGREYAAEYIDVVPKS